MQITTFLMFTGAAEEAMNLYGYGVSWQLNLP